ncbi:unnamed protein product, partial [Heterosigma akashiwo]
LQLEELDAAVHQLKKGKTCGEDLITAEALQYTFNVLAPHWLRLFNACLSLAYFPTPAKRDLTPLLAKAGKTDYSLPRAWRPVCLLSLAARLFELCIFNRLQHEAALGGWDLPNQFAYKENVSREDAVGALVSRIERALSKGKMALLLRLDIVGAFNS